MGPRRHACAALLALLSLGGCTLLIGAQLSDKPEGSSGAGGQDGGGGSTAASTTAASTTAASTTAASTTAASTTGASSGGPMCPDGQGDCDGNAANGCEANLMKDAANCGSCQHQCMGAMHCKDGACH